MHNHSQGLRLARDLKDDYSICSMANCLARALIFGGRLPFTLGEIKALKTEAEKAFKRAKKYISELVLSCFQQELVDEVGGVGSFTS